jgi:hypothetical protein
MRRILVLFAAVMAVALLAAAPASAAETASPVGNFKMTAKVTSVRAAPSGGLVARGVVVGRLRSAGQVVTDRAPVRFRVAQRPRNGRCNVLILNIAEVHLELLGVIVDTSAINLEVTARRDGGILGRLFCAVANAEIRFPQVAVARLNRKLDDQPVAVSQSAPLYAANHEGTCQVLRLVLGPLHLDLLGLVVDLYGDTRTSPVIVEITAQPDHGLLGDLLCSLAGGGNITSLAQLQSLLQSLGVSLTDTQLQNLLTQLGLGDDLTGGLSQLQLQQILAALGLGSTPPA